MQVGHIQTHSSILSSRISECTPAPAPALAPAPAPALNLNLNLNLNLQAAQRRLAAPGSASSLVVAVASTPSYRVLEPPSPLPPPLLLPLLPAFPLVIG